MARFNLALVIATLVSPLIVAKAGPPVASPDFRLVVEPESPSVQVGGDLVLKLRLINQSSVSQRGCVHYPRDCEFKGGENNWVVVKRCAADEDPCEPGAEFELAPGDALTLSDQLVVPDALAPGRATLRCMVHVTQVDGSRMPLPDTSIAVQGVGVELRIDPMTPGSEP